MSYRLFVSALAVLAASASFSVHAAPPSNDSIQNATVIPPGGDGYSVVFDTATAAATDPACGSAVHQSVWYRWTPVQDGFVVAELSGWLSEPRPRVSVWTGTPQSLVQAQCHPDGDAIELAVKAGTSYYFMVY